MPVAIIARAIGMRNASLQSVGAFQPSLAPRPWAYMIMNQVPLESRCHILLR